MASFVTPVLTYKIYRSVIGIMSNHPLSCVLSCSPMFCHVVVLHNKQLKMMPAVVYTEESEKGSST